jgi:hypothetical protein
LVSTDPLSVGADIGAAAAWKHAQGGSVLNILSIGPVLRAGYRLVFGDRGIYVEPTLGFLVFAGGQFGPGGAAAALNTGVTAGLTLGYRF